MIPFAILAGRITTETENELEIRILELAPDFFTFRLPVDWQKRNGKIEHISLSFYQRDCVAYCTVVLQEKHIETETCSDEDSDSYAKCSILGLQREAVDSFSETWRVETESEIYRNAVYQLTREYVSYIEDKTLLEDWELANKMTSYPAEKETLFSKDYQSWLNGIREKIVDEYDEQSWKWTEKFALNYLMFDKDENGTIENGLSARILSNTDFENQDLTACISLENEKQIHDFLKKMRDEFWTDYWKEIMDKDNTDSGRTIYHPLQTIPITEILLGNSYCLNLLPKAELVKAVLHKAAKYEMTVTLVLAPVPESGFVEVMKFVDEIELLVEEMQKKRVSMERTDELKAYAIAAQADHKFIKWQVNDYGMYEALQKRVSTEKGVLLQKTKRDPRRKYRNEDNESDKNLMRIGDRVFLPFYQTNTATFCTLYAAVCEGERGKQLRVQECPKYCKEHCFLYPEHLDMVGRYNSLFGVCIESLADGSVLENLVEKGIKKIILNW